MNANDREERREDLTLHIEQVDTPTDGDLAPHRADSSDTQHIAQPLTQQIETTGTAMNQHDPATPGQAPFKVEPATPVPDDAVQPDDEPSPPPHVQMMPPRRRSRPQQPRSGRHLEAPASSPSAEGRCR